MIALLREGIGAAVQVVEAAGAPLEAAQVVQKTSLGIAVIKQHVQVQAETGATLIARAVPAPAVQKINRGVAQARTHAQLLAPVGAERIVQRAVRLVIQNMNGIVAVRRHVVLREEIGAKTVLEELHIQAV